MTSLKILQYNTDNLRHGWDYFKKNLDHADVAILQRFPKSKRPDLCDAIDGKVFMVESCPPHDLCLAIARTRHAPQFSGTESITLPSAQHVIAIEDAWQGCTALKTIISGVNIISFMPCFENASGEFPVAFSDTKSDIRFLLEKFKDKPTIIMGDFHVDAYNDDINGLIERSGFTSHLNRAKTFRNRADQNLFNLDKCISNVPVNIVNLKVDELEDSVGHHAITYTLEFNLDK